MASHEKLAGYRCKFVSPVSEDLLCKKCNLVARKLSITTCCGESYCYQCIADISQQGGPCQECGIQEFKYFEQTKYQKRINNLEIYCSMKERGCVWSGTLDQLDTHLDPRLDNCQYVDTKCPLNCLQSIPKNEVEQHVAHECPNRPHVCQHCGYNATYEEVVDKHIPECNYVPLQCPNLCGVSCDREDMEDHMKICLKEEVECAFEGVGCMEKFQREYEEKHIGENLSNHLSLTAAESIRTKQELEKTNQDQETKLLEQKQLIEALVQSNKVTKEELTAKINFLEIQLSQLFDVFYVADQFRSLEIKNFTSAIKNSKFFWKSPIMYTHKGAKFFIYIHRRDIYLSDFTSGAAVGGAIDPGLSVPMRLASPAVSVVMGGPIGPMDFSCLNANAHAIKGECDDDLKWPMQVQITLEIVQKDNQNTKETIKTRWEKPDRSYEESLKSYKEVAGGTILSRISNMKRFIINDTFHFRVVSVKLNS